MGNSSGHKLHLVSFNIPYPADNGGLIDVFCKIRALKKAGIDVILHCYAYGRAEAPELEALCAGVYYYPRATGKSGLFHTLPYIVVGRRSEELVQRLAADNHPVLLEGLHCCGILDHPLLAHKRMFVRTHNIEHDYYRGLARVERHPFKRYYFNNEAEKLERFEPILAKAAGIFAISRADTAHFLGKYPQTPVWTASAFHLNDEVRTGPEDSGYALYHGSLDVGENNHAALKLVREVFRDLPYTLVIAGKNPSKELRQACESAGNVLLKSRVDTADIQDLVNRAHINVLPTWQSTGIKLKLLMALFSGRHCLVNANMVKDTGLENLCRVEDTTQDLRKAVTELAGLPFTENEMRFRKQVLEQSFSNAAGAETIIRQIFPSR